MKTVLALLLCVSVAVAYVDYSGYQVIRVTPGTLEKLDALKKLEKAFQVDFWKEPTKVGIPVDIMISPKDRPIILHYLRTTKMSPSIYVEDIGQQIKREQAGLPKAFDINRYNSYDDINSYVHQLASEFNSMTELKRIGTSYEGRDLDVLTVAEGGTTGKRSIWIDGGIHAREWISPAVVLHLMDKLLRGTDTTTRSMRQNLVWHFIPVLNPDGYEYTRSNDRMWRKTRSHPPSGGCRGTDGNRNWSYMWGGSGSSGNTCSDTYRGHEPFSEPETKAASDYILANGNNMIAYLTFHSYGQYWLYPWGYSVQSVPDWRDLRDVADRAVAALRVPYGTDFFVGDSGADLYPAAGDSNDWAYGEGGIKFSYTVELRDKWRYGFILPEDQIEPSGIEMYEAMKSFATDMINW